MRRTVSELHAAIRAVADSTTRLSDDLARSLRFVELAEQATGAGERRRRTWLQFMRRTEQFVASRRRLPTHGGPQRRASAAESELADWLTYQRRRHDRSELCLYERMRLEMLPGFSWTPLLETWERRLEQYDLFLRTRRRKPRFRSADPIERSLVDWIARQRARRRAGRLSDDQLHALAYLERPVRMGPPEHRPHLQPYQ